MQPQEYSEKVQIEILDEVIANQGTTKTIDRTEPIREWNHHFLVTQGYIKEEYASSNVFRLARESSLLVSEKITDSGKIWRSYLYQKNENEKRTAEFRERILWIALSLIVLASYPILRDALSVLGLAIFHH